MQLVRCGGGAFHRHRASCVRARALFRRRHPARAVGIALTFAAVGAAAAFLIVAVGPRTGAYATATVLSGSMAPSLPTGSVVVVAPARADTVRAGQVLTFHAPTPDRALVTHRVAAVRRDDDGSLVLTTEGDANPAPDPWEARITGDTVWRVRAVVPYAGRVVTGLRSPAGRIATTAALPAVLLGWLLAGVWRRDAA